MGIVTHAHGAARSRGADDPILTSKITAPTLPGWVVPRPRVEELIADGVRGPLTTVTGPPGAGKTMAIALWAASASADTVAWLSLDSYDNRPKVFWSYVMAALRRADGHAAADHVGADSLCRRPRLPPPAGIGAGRPGHAGDGGA